MVTWNAGKHFSEGIPTSVFPGKIYSDVVQNYGKPIISRVDSLSSVVYSPSVISDITIDNNKDGIPDCFNPSVDTDGNYIFDNAYGYVFSIDDVNGVIDGEDATIITNFDSYAVSNPIWAVSVQLRPTENMNEYEVVYVVDCPGSVSSAGISFEQDDVVLVVHSASSAPGYDNWMDRVAANALRVGDIVTVSDDMLTISVLSNTISDVTGHDYFTPMSSQWVEYMAGVVSNLGDTDYISYCLRDYDDNGTSFVDHYVLIYDLNILDGESVESGSYPYIDIYRDPESFSYFKDSGITTSVYVPDVAYGSFGSLSDIRKGGDMSGTYAILFALVVAIVYSIAHDIFDFVLQLGKR